LSTLEYLKKIPANEIKIDQSFVKGIVDNRSDRVMVQSTIALAHSLGRKVVAEGVEEREVLEALTEMGCDIVTGGGPGLMQAANEGVETSGHAKSMGIRVDLPFEQEVNPFVELAYEHRTFFTRLHHFVLASDAFIVAPGGIGTVLETMMIWQLLQVRHLERVPLILVGRLWPPLVDWVRDSMLNFETPLINPEDVDIPICVASADEAIEIIRRHRETA